MPISLILSRKVTCMNLNIESWQEFKVGEVFDCCTTSALNINNSIEGNIPYITRSALNNGLTAYYGNIEKKVKGNCITIGAEGTIAFYQPKDFIPGVKLYTLRHPKLNSLNSMFLVTILNSCAYLYSYGRARILEKLKMETIKLPTKDNEIDWKFMEDYIKSINHTPITTKNQKCQLFPLETKSWQEFKITDIFTRFEHGKAHDNLLDDGNDLVYIGAKKDDNGVMRRCGNNAELSHKGNCIIFICNGQGSVGYTLYMNKPFIATTDVRIGYCEELNKYTGLFLVSILDKERIKYSFGRKWGPHLKNTIIKLPAKDNRPDWDYMEKYIKSLPYGDRI